MALTKAKLIELIDNGDIDVGGGFNPNILHNWDFRNPVNQRGVSGTHTVTGTYFFDRWANNSGEVVIYTGQYITLKAGTRITQPIEGLGLTGKTCTMSVIVGTTIYAATGQFPSSITEYVDYAVTGFGVIRLGNYSTYNYISLIADADRNITAVKLELGTVSTLAYDPPMDYGVELAKCQRFCLRLGAYPLVYGYANSTTSGRIYIPTPVQMRINPTLSFSNMFFTTVGGGKDCIAGSLTVLGNGVWAGFSGTGLTAQTPVTGYIGYAGEVIFLYSDL